MKAISFPAEKNELVKQVQKNKAPNDVIQLLDKLEEEQYQSPADVAKELGNLYRLVCGNT